MCLFFPGQKAKAEAKAQAEAKAKAEAEAKAEAKSKAKETKAKAKEAKGKAKDAKPKKASSPEPSSSPLSDLDVSNVTVRRSGRGLQSGSSTDSSGSTKPKTIKGKSKAQPKEKPGE